jgi:hypothetical protein
VQRVWFWKAQKSAAAFDPTLSAGATSTIVTSTAQAVGKAMLKNDQGALGEPKI